MVEMGKNPYAMTARALSLLVCVGVISFGLVLTHQMIFKSMVRLRPNSSSSNDQYRQLKGASEVSSRIHLILHFYADDCTK